MKALILTALLCFVLCPLVAAQTQEKLPLDEKGAIAYLKAKKLRIQTNDRGHAVRLFSSGKPSLTPREYQLIGLLTHLEQIGINGAPLLDGQWKFLQSLPKLKRLAVWHGHKFTTLKPFNGLPVERLTIGGCMGLRNLNRKTPNRYLHAVKTLAKLPNIRQLSLYHSPLCPDDSHLAHIAKEFPKLQDLRLDFASPRGSKTRLTPKGLAALQKLPLEVLSIENASHFTAKHFKAIAGVKTLKILLVDARRKPVPAEGLAMFRKVRPDVQVAVAKKGDKGPPRVKKKR